MEFADAAFAILHDGVEDWPRTPVRAPHVERDRIISGGTFALDVPSEPEAICGRGDLVVWSRGEPLMLNGPTGVGKTTAAQRLLLASTGIAPAGWLGFPVAAFDRPVLYVAADRPRQARRSLRRMVDDDQRALLDDRVLVHAGPLPFSIVREPSRLAEYAVDLSVAAVFIDSLKDVAARLADDETGALVGQAFQHVVAAEIELVVLHHNRKAQADNRRPKELEDVYGNQQLTAAMGSVLALWGRPGDTFVELLHLKQPAADVGPLRLRFDHALGLVEIEDGSTLLDLLRGARGGLTAPDAARLIFGGEPDRNATQRARRRLDDLVAQGHAHAVEGEPTRGSIREPRRYFATEQRFAE